MKVNELKPYESLRLTEGTGSSIMYVIKSNDDRLYITCDAEMKNVTPKGEDAWMYDHFLTLSGEPSDTQEIINKMKETSKDWYTLLQCDVLLNELPNATAIR